MGSSGFAALDTSCIAGTPSWEFRFPCSCWIPVFSGFCVFHCLGHFPYFHGEYPGCTAQPLTLVRILVLWLETEPTSPAVEAPSLNHWTLREALQLFLKKGCTGSQFLKPRPCDGIFLLFWTLVDTLGIHFKFLNNFPSEFLGYCSCCFLVSSVAIGKSSSIFIHVSMNVVLLFSLWKLQKKLLIFALSLVF